MVSDRTGSVTAISDENADGWVDERDDRVAANRVAAGDRATLTDEDGSIVGRAQVDERLAARQRLAARTATTVTDTRAPATISPDDSELIRTAGPRPRASLLATLSLVLGVGAGLTVLTGVLAGPGVGLGLLAAILSVGGISATSRRHVAGKSDAMLGMALGLAAVVVGSLALTGTLPWLSTDTDYVMRTRDWLADQLPFLFPSS